MFSHSGHVMTLANSIIGVGILAMPFCFQKCGIILAILLLIISNWITRICCHYLIKCSLMTRKKSFEFLGFYAFGASGKLLVELCIIGYLLGTCITYFVVVGDLGPQIVTKMFSIGEDWPNLRSIVMIAVTVFCILPLGMLKNVDSLAMVCTASIGFYFCLVIKIIFESKTHIVSNDWTSKVLYWEPAGILQCLPIFSMALSCQMQIFEVFESIHNQSIEKLNGIVKNAVWTCTFVYIAMGFFGYVAFSAQIFSGNILMHFSPSIGSDVINVGFVLSLAFSFPLVIFPCRASIYSLLYRKGHTDGINYIPEARFKVITIFIVSLSLVIALMIPSVELIIGLVGSTIGVAICVIFPALCYRKVFKKNSTERMLGQFIVICGFCFMILGTYANLSAIDQQSSGAHLEVQPIEDNTAINLSKFENKPTTSSINLPKNIEKKENDYDPTKGKKKLKLSNIIKQGNNDSLKIEAKQKDIFPKTEKEKPNPLPIDEKHEESVEVKNVEMAVNKKAAVPQEFPSKSTEKAIIPPPPDPPNISESLNEEKNNLAKEPVKISIDNVAHTKSSPAINEDAIKNAEKVDAEEKINEKKLKSENAELTELKKTKELIERTVDQLKEELAKQNLETQNLVAQKLGAVVEKVEQFERKVHNKEQEKPAENQNQKEATEIKKNFENINSNSLLNKLAKGAYDTKPIKAQNMEKISQPSNKTDKLIESNRNSSKIEQRIPLPLALLINSSHIKVDVTKAGAEPKQDKTVDNVKLAKEPIESTQQNQLKIVTPKADYNLKNVKNTNNNDLKDVNKSKPDDTKIIEQNKNNEEKLEKENVDAIRRDLLQFNSISTLTDKNDVLVRMKRSAERIDFNQNLKKLEEHICLNEPKVDILMSHGHSNAIDLKMNAIGRKLQSVKDDTKK